MFGFHCMGRKKSKIKDESHVSPASEFKTDMNSYTQLKAFNIDKQGRNLFSQCFRGNKKCTSTDSHLENFCDNKCLVNTNNDCAYNDKENGINTYETPYEGKECSPQRESLAKKIFQLANYGWYWGPLSHSEASAKLQDESDGSFLVRDSSCEQYVLTLSFRSHGQTFHTRIDHAGGMFSIHSGMDFNSVEDLIKHSMSQALLLKGDPSDNNFFTITLSRPISRFTQVRPLQYLCRFVIRQYVRADIIPKLPLPQSVVKYVEEGQF